MQAPSDGRAGSSFKENDPSATGTKPPSIVSRPIRDCGGCFVVPPALKRPGYCRASLRDKTRRRNLCKVERLWLSGHGHKPPSISAVPFGTVGIGLVVPPALKRPGYCRASLRDKNRWHDRGTRRRCRISAVPFGTVGIGLVVPPALKRPGYCRIPWDKRDRRNLCQK